MGNAKTEKIRKTKERATRALGRGNYEKALDGFQDLIKLQPTDMRLKLKVGDILLKMKKKDEALTAYEDVALEYANDGFLIQAVSVYKMVLQADPNREGIQDKLHELNEARGIPKALAKKEEKETEEEAPTDEAQPAEAKSAREVRFEETPLFSALGAEEFEKVVARFEAGRIPKGKLIIKEGTKGDQFFIVGSGEVRVFRTQPSGKKVTLAKLGDGIFFGEMAFFLGSIRTASIETTVDTTLLRISRKDLSELMEQYPNVKQVIQDFFKQRAMDTLLKTMPLFACLEDEERRVLIDKFEMEEVELGTLILEEGEEGQFLYVLFQGEVEITTVHEDKGPVKLATLSGGDYFGEISLIQGKLNTADVTASEDCILFKLNKPVFKSLLKMHTPMLEEISKTIDARLKNTIDTLLK